MRDYSLVKINLTGGIASPGMLEGILLMAQKAGVKNEPFLADMTFLRNTDVSLS